MSTLLEVAAHLRAESDARQSDRLHSLAQQGKPVTCGAGCWACCGQLVVVSPLEAHALAESVAREPDLAARIEARTAQWREQVKDEPDLDHRLQEFRAVQGYPESEQGTLLETSYWEAGLLCPFLEEGRCSVYEHRPFACREHHVISPPELCLLELDASTPAPTRMEYRTLATWIGITAFGLPDCQLVLPEALEFARAHPEHTTRQVAPERARELLHQGRRRLAAALNRVWGAARGG